MFSLLLTLKVSAGRCPLWCVSQPCRLRNGARDPGEQVSACDFPDSHNFAGTRFECLPVDTASGDQ